MADNKKIQLPEGIYWNKKYKNRVKLHIALDGTYFVSFVSEELKSLMTTVNFDFEDLLPYANQDIVTTPGQ